MSRSIRIIKRSIRAILCAEPASSADGGHTLPEVGKTAIRRASERTAIVGAPRIILSFGRRSYPDSKNENPHYEHRYSHDCLLFAAMCRVRETVMPNAQADTPLSLLNIDIGVDYVRLMTGAGKRCEGMIICRTL